MRIFNTNRTALIEEEPPSYKNSEAAVYTARFISLVRNVRNTAVHRGGDVTAMYLNTVYFSEKMLNNINKEKTNRALDDLKEIGKHSQRLFIYANTAATEASIDWAYEIYHKIESILNEDNSYV